MAPTEEIMMPVPKPEAVSMAEIHALRGLTDAVATLTRNVERLNEKVDDVRERVIRIEAKNHERAIDTIQQKLDAAIAKVATFDGLQRRLDDALGKIDGLEGVRDKASGALGATGWLTKSIPVLLGIFGGALAALGIEGAAK